MQSSNYSFFLCLYIYFILEVLYKLCFIVQMRIGVSWEKKIQRIGCNLQNVNEGVIGECGFHLITCFSQKRPHTEHWL